ncbi:MFS transporter [Serinicoccus chungangensis]|uniref:MFS transporter n=1 Tax=Serinicoccus chungangensis TaxID=767452 RepID=UPI0023AF9715|nr:MFS transporter [Serinicoccus chungangensis]
MLFADRGLSTAQISVLLAVWSLSAFVLEVPSGAWADLLDRRTVLLVSGVVYVAAFATWMVWPGFWGFLLGFVLWSCSDALHSGTWEAYLFEQLAAHGRSSRYARVKARAESVALLLMAVAIAAAAPLHQLGGYALVGAVSVAVAVLHVGVTLRLPRPARRGTPGPPGPSAPPHPTSPRAVDPAPDPRPQERTPQGWAATLREGLAQARAAGPVRRVLLGYAAVVTLVGVDEYFPLLLADDGAPVGRVALVMAGIVLLEALGTSLSDRVALLTGGRHAALVLLAGALLALGAAGSGWAGAGSLGLGYALASSLYVAGDARLQHALGPSSRTRATVTSMAGVAGEVGFLVTLATVGVLSLHLELTPVVTGACAVLAVPAALAAWRMPPGDPGDPDDGVAAA